MAIVPCPECAKPMEQDDGFCGSCGAITDSDLLLDDGPTAKHPTVPDPVPLTPHPSGDAPADRRAVLGAIDMGGDFDERTDISPPPLDDAPPPPVMPTPAVIAAPPVMPTPPVMPPPPIGAAEPPADNFQAFLEEQTGAFVPPGTGLFEEETGSHRADRQAMVQPQVVLRCKAGVDLATLSPFEQHVLSFLDGRRPLARLRKKAGLSFGDLKVAIGMLADRGAIEVVGSFVPDLRGLLEVDEVADSGPHAVVAPPPPASAAPARPPPRPAPMPLPGQGMVPPRTATPPPHAAPARAGGPPPVVVAPNRPDAARIQANQLLERALAELRAGKRPAAVALLRMAAELLPGDPKIEAALKSLLVH